MHDQGLIFRDLKPENILIDYEGNTRLVDFGLTRHISKDLNQSDMTFCGSPEYLSPEMLLQENRGLMIDFYSLGAVLYEFVVGCPPFYSEDQDKMFLEIVNSEIDQSEISELSPEC